MARRTLFLALAAVLAALPLGSRAADDPFEIDVSLPLTGQVAFLGSETAKGVRAAEGFINAHGGIRGRPIKFVIADDQSNPQVAVQVMSQFLARKPAVVIGGELVANCSAASGLLKPDGPVFYCLTPGVHPAAGSWVYSGSFSTVDMVATAIRYLRESGLTKIATITTIDASGQDGDRTIAEALGRPENASIVVTTKEHFATSDISVSAQLSRISSSGAQAIIAWESGTPFGTVLRGVTDSGVNLPIVTTPANLVYKQLEQYKSIMPQSPLWIPGIPVVVPEAIADRGVHQAIVDFTTAMKTQGVPDPDVSDTIPWDPLRIIVDAYRKYGFDATATQIRDYINGVHGMDGILGVLDYRTAPQRGVQPQWCLMVRWDPNANRFVAVSKLGGSPIK